MFLIYVGISIVLRLKKDRYRIRYLCSILFTIAAHFGFQICFTYLDWNHLTTAKLLCLQAFQLLLLILVIQQYFYFLRQHDFRIKKAKLQGLQLEIPNSATPIRTKATISLGGYTRRASDGAGTDAGLCVCSCLGTDTWADTDSVDGFGTGGFCLLLSHML